MTKAIIKTLLSKVLNTPLVIEQGTSGIWTYRKWSDGTAECWGSKDISGSYSSWGNAYTFSVVLVQRKCACIKRISGQIGYVWRLEIISPAGHRTRKEGKWKIKSNLSGAGNSGERWRSAALALLLQRSSAYGPEVSW